MKIKKIHYVYHVNIIQLVLIVVKVYNYVQYVVLKLKNKLESTKIDNNIYINPY
jgi:hypothetical protein